MRKIILQKINLGDPPPGATPWRPQAKNAQNPSLVKKTEISNLLDILPTLPYFHFLYDFLIWFSDLGGQK